MPDACGHADHRIPAPVTRGGYAPAQPSRRSTTAPRGRWGADRAHPEWTRRPRDHERVPRRPLDDPRSARRPRRAAPDRVAVRAGQRPRRDARQPRRGGAARDAGHLPQLVLRVPPAAARRGRLRVPGRGPDAGQRPQRQADPGARRRRAARRALRPGARAQPHARHAGGHADPPRRLGLPQRPAGDGDVAAARVVLAALGGGDLLRGRRARGRRLGRAARRPVRALRERADAGHRGRPARRGRAARRPGARAPLELQPRRAHDPPDAALGAAGRRGHGAPGLRARRRPGHELVLQQRRAHHGDHPAQARRDPPRGQVHGVRLVEPALPARDRRPGRGRAGRLGLHRLGRPRRRAARVPRRVLGQGRPRDRRRPAAAAGAAVLPLPGAAGRRAGRAPGDRRQGPHRAGLRRALLLGRRDVRAAGVHVHPAAGGRRRAALAPQHPRHRLRARRAPGPQGRGVRLADDQRRGVLGLLARGHRGVPRQRRHRRRRHALRRGDRRQGVRARGRRRPAGGHRAAVALAGPPRQRQRVPHRRRHRPRRVLRGGRQQRLHEPHGAEEPARRRRRRGALAPRGRAAARRRPRRSRAGAVRRPRW